MGILKRLPPARDARIYMAMERTYLGYLRFGIYIISLAVFCQRMALLAVGGGGGGQRNFHLYTVLAALTGIGIIAMSIRTLYRGVNHIDKGVAVTKLETVDPRIYMAAERTFLAWIRTSISLIIFGFVVENFELLLNQIGKDGAMKNAAANSRLVEIGIFIILAGMATIVIGLINFRNAIRQVDFGKYRTAVNLYQIYGYILFAVCLILIILLFNLV